MAAARVALVLLALAAGLTAAGAPAGGGVLDVAPEASWSGGFGVAIALSDTVPSYLETTTPDDEKRWIARFYFDADGVTVAGAGSIVLLRALSPAAAPVVSLVLRSNGGGGKELVYTVATDGASVTTPAIAAPAGWHLVELDWKAATAPGVNDGSLATRLDGAPAAALAALDNDQSRVALARWGAVAVTAGAAGSLWIDDFASRRTGAIGPVLAGSLDVDGDGSLETMRDGVLLLRALFGFDGAALTDGAVGPGCRHCTAEQILGRFAALRTALDVDADGEVGALGDGLLILRFLDGFGGAALISGAVGEGAQRDAPAEIATYLRSLE
jgi:hypothetical protein